jgi:CheY-like chemotaxis protein
MVRDWNILVVDDEPDVHTATQLALKYSKWKGRGFKLISANSGAEAARLLASSTGSDIDVALIDVVMETDDAGLTLCRLIRAKLPRTLRIILRTGQAGVAPEERVLNDHDIDYYLSKSEVTQQRLYATLRACLRSSQDIATIIALETQLRDFMTVLQRGGTLSELMPITVAGIKFLEAKHEVRCILVNDLATAGAANTYRHPLLSDARGEALERARSALAKAHNSKLETLQSGPPVGLNENEAVLPTIVHQDPENLAPKTGWSRFAKWFRGRVPAAWEPIRGGLYAEFRAAPVEGALQDFQYDCGLFFKNWNLAFTTLQLQENVARQRAVSAEAFWYVRAGGKEQARS